MLNLYRGLNHQATIIATAPLIEVSAILFALIEYLSEALYPAAYGLGLAILTTWSRDYLTHRADALLTETRLPQ